MPNSRSAKKSFRQSERRRLMNLSKKRQLKSAKRTAVDNPSAENLSAAYKAIDKAAKVGYLKKSAAARRKSRIAKTVSRKASE